MLRHIVFFKLKEPTQENIGKVKEALLGLKGKIPELLEIEVGSDIIHSERSFDIALVSTFRSLDEMNAYQVNPIHLEVSNMIATLRESAASVDYEF